MFLTQIPDTSPASTLIIWNIRNVATEPIVTSTSIAVPTYLLPNLVSQPTLPLSILTGDTRTYAGVVQDNHLWTAHNISEAGIIDSLGNLKALVQWFDVNINAWPLVGLPTLNQSQIINPPGDDSVFFPGINVDMLNNTSIAFNIGGNTRNISIGYANRLFSDPLGTTRSILVVINGPTVYTSGPSPHRWGDYSGLVIDPADGLTFWLHNMFPLESNNWGTAVVCYTINNALGAPMVTSLNKTIESLDIETSVKMIHKSTIPIVRYI